LKYVSLHLKQVAGETKPFSELPGKIDPETTSVR